MAYVSQTDLENALGRNTIAAVFDDDGDGVPEQEAIDAACESASAEVDAVLIGTYSVTLPLVNPPAIVKFAAVDFACAYAARRRPDIVRAMSEKSWTDFRAAALDKMKMIASAFERLPKTTAAAPSNVGGVVVDNGSRLTGADPDGSDRQGGF
jgi:phage gp36-like protein